jgi:hypothetical protein
MQSNITAGLCWATSHSFFGSAHELTPLKAIFPAARSLIRIHKGYMDFPQIEPMKTNLQKSLLHQIMCFGVRTIALLLLAYVCESTTARAEGCTSPPAGLDYWWPGSGNALDVISGNNGTLQGGVTFSAGEVGESFNFDGTNAFVTTSLLVANPQSFSLSMWFRTATTEGGVLIGFDSSQTSVANGSEFDRHIYMDNSGALHFGVWNAGAQQINTAGGYNDSNWHFVVGTFSPGTGLSLFVDGVLAGSNPAVTNASETYNGYWRFGEDNLNNWPYQPTSYYFKGQIDEVTVFNDPLSSSSVAAIYAAGSAGMCNEAATFLPVYQVAQAGATLSQSLNLANQLNIPTNQLAWANGVISYIDPATFAAIPTIALTNTSEPAISNLIAGTKNPNPAVPISVQAIDFATLTNLSVLENNSALGLTSNALAEVGLTPQFGTPGIGHTVFIAFVTNADKSVTSAKQYLDTTVNYTFSIPYGTNYVPMLGTGAKAQVVYGGAGNVTRLFYTAPQLAAGPSVQIISPTEASNRIATLLPPNAQFSAQLVYLAPSLWPNQPACSNCPSTTWHPTNIIPWIAFTGTFTRTNPLTGTNMTISTKRQYIPATDDTNYVPSINLLVSQVGTQIVASVSASGGSPPYTYMWSGSDPSVSSDTGPSITYKPVSRVVPPPLSIALDSSSSMVNVSWPYPSDGFNLEYTTNLTTTRWFPVNNTLTNASYNGFNVATISATADLFLRLACETVPATETLSVIVTDANGVCINTNHTLEVQAQPLSIATPTIDPPTPCGIENPHNTGNDAIDATAFYWAISAVNNNTFNTANSQIVFNNLELNSSPGDFLENPVMPLQTITVDESPPVMTYNGPMVTLSLTEDAGVSGVNTAMLVLYESDAAGWGGLGFTYNGIPNSLMFSLFNNVDGLIANNNAPMLTLQLDPTYEGVFSYDVSCLLCGDTWTETSTLNTLSWGNSPGSGFNTQILNWMLFDAPNVLQYNANNPGDLTSLSGGFYPWQRWGPAFNGLHMMLGWHNTPAAGYDTAGYFATLMTASGTFNPFNDEVVSTCPPVLSIVQAWMDATTETIDENTTSPGWFNPFGVFGGPSVPPAIAQEVPAAMGPIDGTVLQPFNNLAAISDFNDYYPNVQLTPQTIINLNCNANPSGAGTSGVSIPTSSITGWWYMFFSGPNVVGTPPP